MSGGEVHGRTCSVRDGKPWEEESRNCSLCRTSINQQWMNHRAARGELTEFLSTCLSLDAGEKKTNANSAWHRSNRGKTGAIFPIGTIRQFTSGGAA